MVVMIPCLLGGSSVVATCCESYEGVKVTSHGYDSLTTWVTQVRWLPTRHGVTELSCHPVAVMASPCRSPIRGGTPRGGG